MKFIENEYCELKIMLTKDIKKEIIAFANTNGGKIYNYFSFQFPKYNLDNEILLW